jgi:hypothetical protein
VRIGRLRDGCFLSMLADDDVPLVSGDHVLDRVVFMPREDDEEGLLATHGFVLSNRHAHRFGAVLVTALAKEIGFPVLRLFVAATELLRDLLDPVVHVPKQAFVLGDSPVSPHDNDYAAFHRLRE